MTILIYFFLLDDPKLDLMITTRDVLQKHDEIHSVWELGMHENAMTKNEIIKANIQEIANNILSKREGFVFRLSGVLLCGIARLYSKKSHIFLIDCEEAIARISLRFEPIDKKKKRNGREKDKNNLEIDDETIKLWQGEKNLESIIELEQKDEINSIQAEIILNSPETNTSPDANTRMIADNDFGNVPFEISACSFEDPLNDLSIQADIGNNVDDNIPLPSENENDEIDFNTLDTEEKDGTRSKNSKKNWYVIDPAPIIPLTQLSVILEDASKTLCQRPVNKTRIMEIPQNKIVDRDELINEVKRIVEKVPVFNGESVFNDDPIVDLPHFSSDDQNLNENDYFGNADDDDDFQYQRQIGKEEFSDQEQSINQKLYSIDIISNLKHSLEGKNEEMLLNIVPNHSRRSLALSFFTALSLKNRGIVEISQSSAESISISKGPNFNSLYGKIK